MDAEFDFTQAAVMGFGLSGHVPQPTNNGRRILQRIAGHVVNSTAAAPILKRSGDKQRSLERELSRNTQMKVVIQKLNGLWHLIVGSCQIRTPFLDTQDRALVITYARRAYPGARIFQRD
ncbi:hypothetical protein [Bradyrhizobium sp. 195]|uniref:hypothetical protein n=1 Tax=Bradyrhizobium sp. 195 TaxID=2782662 RepID=UPI00200108E7|nr:hypothetical protein [Bradyrhizobium sp. 195]UPK30835.1 hypothetical protein IVB26_17390 [Bradyrhizobium sp. 195]